ncbi:MAG: AIPR family protein, partial [Leptospiraceae bacterium]|nr:AIPR family protein [Leptospiraceae bacterium]
MLVSKKDLENSQSIYKWGWKKDDFFSILFLSREFHKPVEDLKANVQPGKSELGVNAFYLDRDRRNFYLYCFLWTENHKQFKENFQKLIQSGIEQIFSDTPSKDQFLSQIRSHIFENQSIIDRVFIHFVFNGDPEKAQNSDTMSSLREDLESKKFIMDKYFTGKEVTLTVDFLSNENKRRGGVSATRKTHKYKLELTQFLERQNGEGNKLYLGFLKALDLYSMYEEMGLRLFEKNIRAGLSPENNPNKSIRKSLKNFLAHSEDHKDFAFNHNGVTIAAEHVEFQDGSVIVT